MKTASSHGGSGQTQDDTILVVDDDADLRHLVQDILEAEGYLVATATDGEEAVRWIERQRPRGIALDLKMPVLDGVALVRVVRAKYGASLPTVLVSADGQLAEKARLIGATDYLAKPFNLADLLRVIAHLLGAAWASLASAPHA